MPLIAPFGIVSSLFCVCFFFNRYEANHLHTMIREFGDVYIYYEKDDGRPGIRKGPGRSNDYQMLLNNLLADGKLKFDEDFFTTSDHHNPGSMKALLRAQMERYHWEKEETKDPDKPRWKLTGKSKEHQDDLLITLFMCAFFGAGVCNNPDRIRT